MTQPAKGCIVVVSITCFSDKGFVDGRIHTYIRVYIHKHIYVCVYTFIYKHMRIYIDALINLNNFAV